MSETSHNRLQPGDLPDVDVFGLARSRVLRAVELMDSRLGITEELVRRVEFVGDAAYMLMWMEDRLARGLTDEETERDVAMTMASEMATYFSRSGRMAVRQMLERMSQLTALGGEKEGTYLKLLGHVVGRALLPTYLGVTRDQAVEAVGVGTETFDWLVTDQLGKDPYGLLDFLERWEDVGRFELLDALAAAAERQDLPKVAYLRQQLIEEREGFLRSRPEIDVRRLEEYLAQVEASLTYDVEGRRVVLRSGESGRHIMDLGQTTYKVLEEVTADTVMWYVVFLEYQQTKLNGGSGDLRRDIKRFAHSADFGVLLSPDDLTAVAIVELAAEFGGFEFLAERLWGELDTNRVMGEDLGG